MATTDPRTELPCIPLVLSPSAHPSPSAPHIRAPSLPVCPFRSYFPRSVARFPVLFLVLSRTHQVPLCPSLSSILLFLSSTSHHVVVTSNTRILPVCRANSLLISSTMFRPRALSPSRDIRTRIFYSRTTQLEANFPVQSVAPPTTRLCPPLPASGYNS